MVKNKSEEQEFLKSIQKDLEDFEKKNKTKLTVQKTTKNSKNISAVKKPKAKQKRKKLDKTFEENPVVGKKDSGKTTQTLHLKTEFDVAMDFATKVYQRFNKIIKSIILFGSAAKNTNVPGSDIDVIIIIDDATIQWDQELVAWYREELEKIVKANPYKNELHINTIKLTSWWDDLLRGDPVVMSILREGQALIDFGGFFDPLKYLLVIGKIKSTPESIYSLLDRAPQHLSRSRFSELNAIEGIYWTMVDSAQAALIALGVQPSSPENIASDLKLNFTDKGKLNIKYVIWYRDLLMIHKGIIHGRINDLKGAEIDMWQDRAEEFLKTMALLVDDIISGKN